MGIEQKTLEEIRAERPLSPHLQIYKPQISSILSILHRLTGAFLFLGLLILAWWIVCMVYSDGKPYSLWEYFTTNIGLVLLACWSAALFYHLSNGIRHLFWDIGKGFELTSMRISGVFVLLTTVLLTVLSWGIAFNYIQIP